MQMFNTLEHKCTANVIILFIVLKVMPNHYQCNMQQSFLIQGYFGAMGCFLELMRTGGDVEEEVASSTSHNDTACAAAENSTTLNGVETTSQST